MMTDLFSSTAGCSVRRGGAVQAALAALALLVLNGCSLAESCPDGEGTKTIATGKTHSETLTYESAPWDGPLDSFPAKTRLRFEHGLGVAPEVVNSWVAFSEDGTGGGSDVTENAGNQGRILCVDSKVIVIENDTCEEKFFLRVVATATGTGSTRETCE